MALHGVYALTPLTGEKMQHRAGILSVISAVLFTTAICARSQTAPPSRDSFEVAAIKPGDPNRRQSGVHWQAGGRVANTNATVKALIAFAYGLPEEQILGGEKWLSSDEYSIEAKPDSPIPSGEAGYLQLRTLFQTLLNDRFKVRVHRETREGTLYNLVLARSSKLKAADANTGPGLRTRAGHFIGTAVPISALAQILSQQLARPVVDKTGLNGKYDFELTYTLDALQSDPFGPITRNSPSAPDNNSPSIFTALEEQLGLRLQSTKGPVEVLVIEHAEKPSEN
jgi:uncharacterized protein (TIGR03435 family)